MAYPEFKQGLPLTIPLTANNNWAGIDNIEVEVYQNDVSRFFFSYLEKEGYEPITKTDNTFSFALTAEQTSSMKGMFGIEIVVYNSEIPLDKGCNDNFLFIKPEAK